MLNNINTRDDQNNGAFNLRSRLRIQIFSGSVLLRRKCGLICFSQTNSDQIGVDNQKKIHHLNLSKLTAYSDGNFKYHTSRHSY